MLVSDAGSTCEPCADNCEECAYDDEGTLECSQCASPYTLDSSGTGCEILCDDGQFLDGETCSDCDESCATCSSAEGCDTCKDGYVDRNTDENSELKDCRLECEEGYEWTGESCEVIVLAEIEVTSDDSYVLRCRSAEFSVDTVQGFEEGAEIQDLEWELAVDEETTDYVTDFDGFNSILREASESASGQTTLSLSKIATEMITREVTLKVTASGREPTEGSPVTHTLSVTLLKEAIEALVNYEEHYNILSKDGLEIDFMVYYPECEDHTWVDIDDSILTCNMYDDRWYSQGRAENCNIPAATLGNGQDYYLRVSYDPHDYQAALLETLEFTTEAVETSCRLLGGDHIYTSRETSTTLEAIIVGDQTDIDNFRYEFACVETETDTACALSNAQVGDPEFTIGAYTLKAATLHTYTLSVIDTSFNVYATCDIMVETAPDETDIIELRLIEPVNAFGYLDVDATHNFECEVAEGEGVETLAMDWTWDFRVIDGEASSGSSQFIRTSGNVLQILPGYLQVDTDYQMTCTGTLGDQQGRVQAFYTTDQAQAGLEMSVSPESGESGSTEFTITVNKPEEMLLLCEVGYLNEDSGEDVQFTVDSESAEWKGYTDLTQQHVTTFPAGFSDNILTVYAKCYESTGLSSRLEKEVTVELNSQFNEVMQLRAKRGGRRGRCRNALKMGN